MVQWNNGSVMSALKMIEIVLTEVCGQRHPLINKDKTHGTSGMIVVYCVCHQKILEANQSLIVSKPLKCLSFVILVFWVLDLSICILP